MKTVTLNLSSEDYEAIKRLLVNLMLDAKEEKEVVRPIFFQSMYESKCARCHCKYKEGDYIFRINKTYFHKHCATQEEKDNLILM